MDESSLPSQHMISFIRNYDFAHQNSIASSLEPYVIVHSA